MIEAFSLPEVPVPSEGLVDLSSGELLPSVTLLDQFRLSQQADKQMHMIGHHHEIPHQVACPVEMDQALRYDLGKLRPSEQAFAMSCIEKAMKLFGKPAVKFVPDGRGQLLENSLPVRVGDVNSMPAQPIASILQPLLQDRSR
jgi:hypothetical protein